MVTCGLLIRHALVQGGAGGKGGGARNDGDTTGLQEGARVVVVNSTEASPAPLGAKGVILAKTHGYDACGINRPF